MKKHLRLFIFNVFALWLVKNTIPGFSYSGGVNTLIWASFVLTIVNLFIRPIINLLLLPINLITLGSFRWLINVATLYLVTFLVPQIKINGFLFTGYTFNGFVAPHAYLNPFWVLVLSSLIISLVVTFLIWLSK